MGKIKILYSFNLWEKMHMVSYLLLDLAVIWSFCNNCGTGVIHSKSTFVHVNFYYCILKLYNHDTIAQATMTPWGISVKKVCLLLFHNCFLSIFPVFLYEEYEKFAPRCALLLSARKFSQYCYNDDDNQKNNLLVTLKILAI